ncbi:MAG: hypothetical protein HY552_02795 [Elusimicrobia bacterium]|nr:hypothetical protein [Elusimicrobiota bacterium]
MTPAAILLALAVPAAAAELGGHEPPPTARPGPAAEDRRAVLEEMWQRRVLPPDQSLWSPRDLALLGRIRRAEDDARAFLRAKPGGDRPWVVRPRKGGPAAPARLTKEGHQRYLTLLTQDAIAYFESKGAEAKSVFRLLDGEGRPLFDGRGLLAEEGAAVYRRARLNLEVFWRSPSGVVYGTRRPPSAASTP